MPITQWTVSLGATAYLLFTFRSSFRVALFVPGPSERVVNSRLALFGKLLVCHRNEQATTCLHAQSGPMCRVTRLTPFGIPAHVLAICRSQIKVAFIEKCGNSHAQQSQTPESRLHTLGSTDTEHKAVRRCITPRHSPSSSSLVRSAM